MSAPRRHPTQRRNPLLVPLVALGAALAGCLGGGAGPAALPELPPGTGGIDVLVLDDAFLPLVGAHVRTSDHGEAFADATGVARLDGLPPGPTLVWAAMPGYAEASAQVPVREGVRQDVTLVLEPVPTTGYAETWTQAGLAGCSVSVAVPAFNYSLPVCTALQIAGLEDVNKEFLVWDLGDLSRMTGLWSETAWWSSQLLGSQMRVVWAHWVARDAYTAQPFHEGQGPSPHASRIPVDVFLAMIEERAPDGCAPESCQVLVSHYAASDTFGVLPAGLGVQFQQRYEAHVTVFRDVPLPGAFTVLGDE